MHVVYEQGSHAAWTNLSSMEGVPLYRHTHALITPFIAEKILALAFLWNLRPPGSTRTRTKEHAVRNGWYSFNAKRTTNFLQ